MAERSKELIEVGYFLSRFGGKTPPEQFGPGKKWFEVYRMFYDSLKGGRTVLEFEHSLKNSRDDFDGYFPNGRQGWKAQDRTPARLSGTAAEVFESFESKSLEDIWGVVSRYVDVNCRVQNIVFEDLIAEDTANSNSDNTKTEGGVRVKISKAYERSAKLRQEALEIHGYSCQVCGFDFQDTYGVWGSEFAEVHHIKPLHELKGESEVVNPATDLAVLCANCHRMVHRKKSITLTLDELKKKIRRE